MGPADDWRLTEEVYASAGRGDPFAAAVRATRMAMIVTDPRQHDNPIVFANDAFLKLTGYTRLEVTGRNCRFLQGPETDMEAVDRIRGALAREESIHVDLLNYRKDGSTFHNALFVSPVHGESGELLFFFASQLDVSDRYGFMRDRDRATRELEAALEAKTLLVREIDHRVKNNLQMVSSMIRLQSRAITDPALKQSLLATIDRVEALSTVHRGLHESDDVSRFDMAKLLSDLAQDLLTTTSRSDIALDLKVEPIAVRADRAAALALLFNETITNALKHAFSGRSGKLTITTARDGDHIEAIVADDGVGIADAASSRRSFGSELIETLTLQLGAERNVTANAPSGTRIQFRFPAERIVAG